VRAAVQRIAEATKHLAGADPYVALEALVAP